MTYHANAFPLIRSEPIPVHTYTPIIEPKPVNRPQAYQILGGVAKSLTASNAVPVIQTEQTLQSVQKAIEPVDGHVYDNPEIGRFEVDLVESDLRQVKISEFENYAHIVNRVVDMALTIFPSDYYKYHPDAPYILRDEPYFDKDLISRTGILDAKRYYRGVHFFKDLPVLVLNRETQLRSNGNVLNEISDLKAQFEETREAKIDFNDPPQAFVDYINYLFRGKTADVKGYPGPAVRNINAITWKYRAKDVTPGMSMPLMEYFRKTYGITGLDAEQPLVEYPSENIHETRYHIPQLLSVGHDFLDLERRIPKWRRQQVWGILHPDCKNQLSKIFEICVKIDENLRHYTPEIYPSLFEIAREPLDISDLSQRIQEVRLLFEGKDITVKHPFETSFYRQYSGKNLTFARPAPKTRTIVITDLDPNSFGEFISMLQSEFLKRNNSELEVEVSKSKSLVSSAREGDVILTVSAESDDENAVYKSNKMAIQNKTPAVHQHVTESHADEDSVMQLVMQIALKLGFDPWLISSPANIKRIFGIHCYLDQNTSKGIIFAIAQNSDGSLVRQFDPVDVSDFDRLCKDLIAMNLESGPALYVVGFDRFGLIQKLNNALGEETSTELEYCIVNVEDQEHFRFFETWFPRKAPRYGKARETESKSTVEAFEAAPEGLIVRASENTYFEVTGRTIEKDALKRGCPTPIRLNIVSKHGKVWENDQIVRFLFSMCMMGRASGHMTRYPSPLYYLRSYAHYYHLYGLPDYANLRQKLFHI